MTTRTNQKRKKVKRLMNRDKKTEYNRWMPYICAILGIMVVSVAGVLVVRAYLTAVTNNKINPFAPMTYTNTEIDEPATTWNKTPTDANPDITIDKSAIVKNLPGNDKKPVFIRVAVTYSVYNGDGVNVTSDYPINELQFTQGDDWTKGSTFTNHPDEYYYYNAIVIPGDQTTEFFKTDVTVDFDSKLPAGYRVEIDVIADTVQAVSTDSAKWKASDYIFAAEAQQAWPNRNASISAPADTSQQVPASVTWS
jgi:hypothetical protein